jgi:hypothetical protein
MGYAHKVVLIFTFLTALSAPAFTPDTATDLIRHAKKLSDLRAEGAAPFHLGIVFTLNGSLSISHGDSPGTGDGSFVETSQRFDEAAKQAVLQWKFRPALCGDEPVEVPINIEVSNRIR